MYILITFYLQLYARELSSPSLSSHGPSSRRTLAQDLAGTG